MEQTTFDLGDMPDCSKPNEQRRPLDLDSLRRFEFRGEDRIVDVDLAAALGYRRERALRHLIERCKPVLRSLGHLPHRVANSHDRYGRGRPTDEYLLNHAQATILVMRCGLPNTDLMCIEIARVFTAWKEGRLAALDLSTAVELRDAAEATGIDGVQLELNLIRETLSGLSARQEHHIDITKEIHTMAGCDRVRVTPETKAELNRTLMHMNGGYCLICDPADRVRILDGSGAPISPGKIYTVDHWNGRYNSEPECTMPECVGCNNRLKNPEIRLLKTPIFVEFQRIRKALSEKQIELRWTGAALPDTE